VRLAWARQTSRRTVGCDQRASVAVSKKAIAAQRQVTVLTGDHRDLLLGTAWFYAKLQLEHLLVTLRSGKI
jgi:hypothetical protein